MRHIAKLLTLVLLLGTLPLLGGASLSWGMEHSGISSANLQAYTQVLALAGAQTGTPGHWEAITGDGTDGAQLLSIGGDNQGTKYSVGEDVPAGFYNLLLPRGKQLKAGTQISTTGAIRVADEDTPYILVVDNEAGAFSLTLETEDATQVAMPITLTGGPTSVKIADGSGAKHDVTNSIMVYPNELLTIENPEGFILNPETVVYAGFERGGNGEFIVPTEVPTDPVELTFEPLYGITLNLAPNQTVTSFTVKSGGKTIAHDGTEKVAKGTLITIETDNEDYEMDPAAFTASGLLPAGKGVYKVNGEVTGTVAFKKAFIRVTEFTVSPASVQGKAKILYNGQPVEIGKTKLPAKARLFVGYVYGWEIDPAQTVITGATLAGSNINCTDQDVVIRAVYKEKEPIHVTFTSDITGWKVTGEAGQTVAPNGTGTLFSLETFFVEAPAGMKFIPSADMQPDNGGYYFSSLADGTEVKLVFKPLAHVTVSYGSNAPVRSLYLETSNGYTSMSSGTEYEAVIGAKIVPSTVPNMFVDLGKSKLVGMTFDKDEEKFIIKEATASLELHMSRAPEATLTSVQSAVDGWGIRVVGATDVSKAENLPISLSYGTKYELVAPEGYRVDWAKSQFTHLTVDPTTHYLTSEKYDLTPTMDLKFLEEASVTVVSTPATLASPVSIKLDGTNEAVTLENGVAKVLKGSVILVEAPVGYTFDYNASSITGGTKLTDGKFEITEASATLNLAFEEAKVQVEAINPTLPAGAGAYRVLDLNGTELAVGSEVPVNSQVTIEAPKNYQVKELTGSGFKLIKSDYFAAFIVTGNLTLNITFEKYPPVQVGAVEDGGVTGWQLLLASDGSELQLATDYDKYTEFYIEPPDGKALAINKIIHDTGTGLGTGLNGTFRIINTIPTLKLSFKTPSGVWALMHRVVTDAGVEISMKRFNKSGTASLAVGESVQAGDGISFTPPLGYEIDWEHSDFGLLEASTKPGRKDAHVYDLPESVAAGSKIDLNLKLTKIDYTLASMNVNNSEWGAVTAIYEGAEIQEGANLEGGKEIIFVAVSKDVDKYELTGLDANATKGLKFIGRDRNRYRFQIIGKVEIGFTFGPIDPNKVRVERIAFDPADVSVIVATGSSLVEVGNRLAPGTEVSVVVNFTDKIHKVLDEANTVLQGLTKVNDPDPAKKNKYTVDGGTPIVIDIRVKDREKIAVTLNNQGNGTANVKLERETSPDQWEVFQPEEALLYPQDKIRVKVAAASGSTLDGSPAIAGATAPVLSTGLADYLVVGYVAEVVVVYTANSDSPTTPTDPSSPSDPNTPTAVESSLLSSVRVFPNPVASTLRVEGLSGTTRVELYSATGQLVRSVVTESAVFLMDATSLPSGVYYLRLQDAQGLYRTLRVVKR